MKYSDLHDYQLFCVKHIIDNDACGLFLDMGFGKTVITLTAIEYLVMQDLEVDSVLVVSPKRVTETVWAEEVQNWEHLKHLKVVKVVGNQRQRLDALQQKAHIHLISRDNFVWLTTQYGGRMIPFDMVVFDELSSFKDYRTNRFKAARNVRQSIKRVVGLTGTPAPNGLINLWPQLYLLDYGKRLGRNITRYRQKYFTRGYDGFSYSLQEGAGLIIRDKIKDICISLDNTGAFELPGLFENVIKIPMTSEVQAKYTNFEKTSVLELFNDDIETLSVVNAAALANKLLQFSGGSIYDEERAVHVVHDLKLKALVDLVEDSGGQNMLIAYNYKHERDRILKALKAYNPVQLQTDQHIRDWNDGKIQILIAHPASMGHGLNMQRGGHIITWYSQTYSLELYLQTVARLYRQGQTQPVVNNILMLEGSIDERVYKILKGKDEQQNSLLDAVRVSIAKYTKHFK